MSDSTIQPQEKPIRSSSRYVYIGMAIGALIGLMAYVQHWL